MYKAVTIGLISICLLIAGCATSPRLTSIEGMPADTPIIKVQLKDEDCKWVPEIIRVEKDSHILLEVQGVDWDYNFRMIGYDLRFHIPKGDTITAEIYTSQTGEFEFGCYIEKGLRYYWGGMVGKFIVE